MDELNPITGGPYKSREEYDEVAKKGWPEIRRLAAEDRLKRAQAAREKADAQSRSDPSSCVQGCAASQQTPDEEDGVYKPVIPNQEYTDQTCSNERLAQLRDELTKAKEAAMAPRLPFKPPKLPYDEDDPKQAAKKKLLCEYLRKRLSAWQDLEKIRKDIQEECFKSAKTTEDEKQRGDGHKKARVQTKETIENIQSDIARYGCP